ncbi:unnamed protein product [Cunninghamella echinulata]
MSTHSESVQYAIETVVASSSIDINSILASLHNDTTTTEPVKVALVENSPVTNNNTEVQNMSETNPSIITPCQETENKIIESDHVKTAIESVISASHIDILAIVQSIQTKPVEVKEEDKQHQPEQTTGCLLVENKENQPKVESVPEPEPISVPVPVEVIETSSSVPDQQIQSTNNGIKEAIASVINSSSIDIHAILNNTKKVEEIQKSTGLENVVQNDLVPEIIKVDDEATVNKTEENYAPQAEEPQVEEVKPEVPQFEEVKSEVPHIEEVTPEVPHIEEVKPEVSQVEEVKPEVSQVEEVKPEVSQVEEVKPEVPHIEEVTPEVPHVKEVKPEVSQVEEVKSEVPHIEEVTPEVPHVEEVKPEVSQVEEVKSEVPHIEEVKPEVSQVEEPKVEEIKAEEIKENITAPTSAPAIEQNNTTGKSVEININANNDVTIKELPKDHNDSVVKEVEPLATEATDGIARDIKPAVNSKDNIIAKEAVDTQESHVSPQTVQQPQPTITPAVVSSEIPPTVPPKATQPVHQQEAPKSESKSTRCLIM